LLRQRRLPAQALRKLVDSNCFRAEVRHPLTSMKMVQSMVGINRPKAIEEAEELAREEK
jgi:hypothetical protein